MILVASPDKPFTYTAKNTPRRHAIIEDYDQEINQIYLLLEQQHVRWSTALSTGTISLRELVVAHLDVNPNDFALDVPFTAYGLDSLSASRLASSLNVFLPVTQAQLLADMTFGELEVKVNATMDQIGRAHV